jgi:choline kinase
LKNLILIVIYNTNIAETETIKSLLDSKEYLVNNHLFIWDNSQIFQDISIIKETFNQQNTEVTYEHHPENLPLSKLYNNVINRFYTSKL